MINTSLRLRLTLSITILTAGLLSLGIFFGTAALRYNIEQMAVDREFDETLDEDLVDLALSGELELLEAAEGELDEFDELALEEILAEESFEQDYLNLIVGNLDIQKPLTEAFGDSEGNVSYIFPSGQVLEMNQQRHYSDLEPTDAEVLVVAASVEALADGLFDERLTNTLDTENLILAEREVEDLRFGIAVDLTGQTEALDEVAQRLWVAMVLLTVLATVGAWILLTRALTPVQAITNKVDEITSGSLGQRVTTPPQRDEIGHLAITMNKMLARLEYSDLARRQFVSDASHELRTPVAVIKSEAETALRRADSQETNELAGTVLIEADRLTGMVEDLLLLAKYDETQHPSTYAAVDLDEIVLAETARRRQVDIDRSAISAGRVRGDKTSLTRMITHLLDNAARHADSRVAVGVSSNTNPGTVVLWVADDGDGIPEADRKRVC